MGGGGGGGGGGEEGGIKKLWSTFCADPYFSICSTTIIPP